MNTLIEDALGRHYASLLTDRTHADPPPSAVSEQEFRTAMGALPTGVSLLTTQYGDGDVWGMTVGSLTSLSLRPALLLVCLHRSSTTLELLAQHGRFAVSILAADQRDIADTFARPRDRNTVPGDYTTVDGLPVIPGALAWLTCEHQHTYASGDHAIVIGAVRKAGHRRGEPLLRHASRYRQLQ
ncbi:flavin reductase family protein [Solwaraspora sp. WMMD1047]|uniref:flavin reductase family protein n=1 Tax=Solwaraspora sp. WMMD1047 TaxID=3016102 RepID=UPI002416A3DD|nr:flavin reductase family protein [Solwaraspora sp. WMMD1047]MDG4834216.1 flavin reductase family protein [Solwaraspora sp. WMMD1047]